MIIVTWLWGDGSPYQPEHVAALARQLAESATMPYRFLCIADSSEAVAALQALGIHAAIAVRSEKDYGGCTRRLKLFDPGFALSIAQPDETIVCIDLDVVIAGNCDGILEKLAGSELVIAEGITPQNPYNGSIFSCRAGRNSELWDLLNARDYATAASEFVGTDQAWIAYVKHKLQERTLPTVGVDDGLWQYRTLRRRVVPPSDVRMLFFAGRVKPWGSA